MLNLSRLKMVCSNERRASIVLLQNRVLNEKTIKVRLFVLPKQRGIVQIVKEGLKKEMND